MRKQIANQQKLKLYYSALALGLTAIIIVHLLVPVYPAFTLPAIPDLFGVAVMSGLLGMAWKLGRPIIYPKIQFFRYELILLGLIWFNVLFLIAPRAFLSLFNTPGQAWIPCNIIPGFATKLECFLQASVTQHYGIRNFFILFIGTLLGTLVFLLAKTVREAWKFLLSSVVFGNILVVIAGLLGAWLNIQQVLPKSLVNNPDGVYSMTEIFDNPGPVWTYLAPGLAISLWLTVATQKPQKINWGIFLSCLLISGILATGQRGGFLLCLVNLIIYIAYLFTIGLKKKKIFLLIISGILLAGLGNLVYKLTQNPLLISEIANSIGYTWKSKPMFFAPDRFSLWIAALNFFKESSFWGHGYASWYQLIAEYAQTNSNVGALHSAHNWFIQLLPELGIYHTIFIIFILFFVAFCLKQSCTSILHGNLLFMLIIISFIITSSLIELDYVRPIFYIHVITWSTLIGLTTSLENKSERLHQNTVFLYFTKPYYLDRRGINSRFIQICLGITGLCILISIVCIKTFSWGGSAFEANLSQPSSAVFRWLGQSASVAAFKTAENKSYSISDIQPFEKPISIKLSDFEIEVNPEESLALSLENGSKWLPKQHPLSFSKGMPDTARWISAGIYYPFLQSDLSIPWSKNMYWWEITEGKLGRWCGSDCWFLAQSCGVRDRVNFSVSAPGRDRTPANPISFDVAVYNLPQGSQFSSQTLEDLPSPLTQAQYQMQSQEAQQLSVEGKPDTALYLVHVESQSTFTPTSDDDRSLGVFIQEPDCQGSR